MSMGVTCHSGSKLTPDGEVISPDLKKVKKPRQQATHNMILSRFNGSRFSVALIFLNTYSVISSVLGLGFGPLYPSRLVEDAKLTPKCPSTLATHASGRQPRDRTALN